MASTKSKVKKAAKKAFKKNPKGFIIAIVALVLVIAIGIGVIYFAFPNTWNSIVSMVYSSNDYSNNSVNGNKKASGSNLNISDGELNIYFVDVEQGDCIIIIFPDGKTMMIDGGDTSYANEVTGAMDKLNITTLNYVLLTHTDADHCGSLDNAIDHASYVENVYLPKVKSKDYDLGLSSDYLQKSTVVYNNFVKASLNAKYKDGSGTEKSANMIFNEDIITIEDEAKTYKFTMYCRNDEYYKSMKDEAHSLNDASPICVLEFNNRIAVFTGDANSSTGKGKDTSSEKNFLDIMANLGYVDNDDKSIDNFDADIVKIPHHGGVDSSGQDFLDFIDCEYAVVCVGGVQDTDDDSREYNLFINEDLAAATDYTIFANEKYGHPNGAVCKEGGRLDQAGVKEVYYTWFNGDIHCKIDKNGNITFDSTNKAVLNGNVVKYENAQAA